MTLDVLLPYLKMGEYILHFLEEMTQLHYLLCIITPPKNVCVALQKVSHQSGMTVEQRTEEANWFRKIGTMTLPLLDTSVKHGMPSLEILQHLHFVCVCVCVLVKAWNSALQCESSPDRMRDFFVLSYQASVLISFVR